MALLAIRNGNLIKSDAMRMEKKSLIKLWAVRF